MPTRDPVPADRDALIALVSRLTAGDADSEEAADAAVAQLERAVLDPQVSDDIFWPERHFDHEPTAEAIVDRVLACRPIVL